MGALEEATSVLPPGWREDVADRVAQLAAADGLAEERVWRLWLEAERCRLAGKFALADEALTAAGEIAASAGWTPGGAPVWGAEAAGLRAKLLQDDGEPAQAYEPLKWALQCWLYIGAAFQGEEVGDADFAKAALRGAAAMVTSLVSRETLASLAKAAQGTAFEVAASTWMIDRLASQAREIAARTVRLTADVLTYSDARRLVNDVLAAFRTWELPAWDPVLAEIGLRQALGSAALSARLLDSALGQADDALALVARLPEGAARSREEAQARSNRAGALFGLGRSEEAARDYEQAEQAFQAVGATVETLRVRTGALRARDDSGDPVDAGTVLRLLRDVEGAADGLERADGSLMKDLELLRRWYLSLLAEGAAVDLEEVVALIEVLRGDRPHMRDGRDHPDPAVARLCRPFAVLAARLAPLPDTVLLVFDPGLHGQRPRPPVFLTVSSGSAAGALRWHLTAADERAAEALSALSQSAAEERNKLVTWEIPIRSEPSEALTKSAARAWSTLPAEVRAALLAARTILYLPSSAGRLDTIPLELLLHEGGWLGTTHVVARCPSFQYLETLMAPNSCRWAEDERAAVVQVAPDEGLGVLADAEADVQTAMRATTVLGLRPERREISTAADALSLFTEGALVHYVGHGFADELGEFLPLSADAAVSASALSDADSTRVPFVFFNACLLGRVRHLAGGRQRGWAVTLLERGAPAVVGALYTVPDNACPLVAEAFYRGAWKEPVGEGMRLARARLHEEGVNPLVWAAYVLHGDPNAVISRARQDGPRATRDLTARWPARLTRFLATQLPEHRDELLHAVRDDATLDGTRFARDAVGAWLSGGAAVDAAALAHAVDELLEIDPEGAAVCRILLAIERMRSGAAGPPPAGGAPEFDTAYLAASALDDGYAMLFLLGRYSNVWDALHPGKHRAAQATAKRWLRSLSEDRGALAPLTSR